MLPLLQLTIPEIVDYDLPVEGVFHNCAFIKIKKECPAQARRVMHAIWNFVPTVFGEAFLFMLPLWFLFVLSFFVILVALVVCESIFGYYYFKYRHIVDDLTLAAEGNAGPPNP